MHFLLKTKTPNKPASCRARALAGGRLLALPSYPLDFGYLIPLGLPRTAAWRTGTRGPVRGLVLLKEGIQGRSRVTNRGGRDLHKPARPAMDARVRSRHGGVGEVAGAPKKTEAPHAC